MINHNNEIVAFHDEKVTLSSKEQAEMRARRYTNRRRLLRGLKRDGAPRPIECRSQGSYRMHTMVQQPGKDYDIDDGIYFRIEDLKGPRGGAMLPGDAKEMVRKALHDARFNVPPESRTNCVRILYNEGYHVDMPAYRRISNRNFAGVIETWYELASTQWKRSNPLAVTEWFTKENKRQSPDQVNGGQLRRLVRLLKAFAKSRPSWRDRNASGFMITVLVVESYRAALGRDDLALYETAVSIRNRLRGSLEIAHPTVPGEMLTSGPDDARTKFLREKLGWAIDQLESLVDPNCPPERSLRAWDRVFFTDFFSAKLQKYRARRMRERQALTGTPLVRQPGRRPPERPVDKRGGGRFG